MKLRALWYALGGAALALVPAVAAAQNPLVSCQGAADCDFCKLGQLAQNVINFVIGLAVPIAVLLFAYAGWLYFSSAENEEKIKKAKRVFSTVFIGFIIALSGWLAVQTVLKGLAPGYKNWNTFQCTGTRLMNISPGAWLAGTGLPTPDNSAPQIQQPTATQTYNYDGTPSGSVVCQAGSSYDFASQNCQSCYDNGDGTKACEVTAPLSSTAGYSGCPAGATMDPSGYNCQVCYDDGSGGQQCDTVPPLPPASNTDCSPENIQNAAASGGYTLTQSQAQTLSCIAVPESACGQNTSVATTPGGQVTSATGMFQIVMGYNDTCHNLNIPSCTQAAQSAGYTVDGSLNCSQHFRGGVPIDQQGQACKAAASNINCNASAAACLVQANNGRFSDWTADSRSSQQAQCVQRYGS